MKKIIHLCIAILISLFCSNSVLSQSFFVGEIGYLSDPSVPGTLGATAWECLDGKVGVSETSSGARIVIYKYFEGTSTVQCQYNYTYYVGSTKYYMTNQYAYYNISCKPSTITLSDKEIEIEPGELYKLTCTNSSGYDLPEIEWTTSDKKVALLHEDYIDAETRKGVMSLSVKGVAVGTCTITCNGKNGSGPQTCTIHVVDDRPHLTADVESGAVTKGTKVTLTCDVPGADIRYTTDNTPPTKNSKKYTSPIVLTESIKLNAKAYANGKESKTLYRNYTVVAHAEGEVFKAKTEEGVEMTFESLGGYLQVGRSDGLSTAIPKTYTGHVTIPMEIDGMRVGMIASKAFSECQLSSLTFSINQVRIQPNAFQNCVNLRYLTLPCPAYIGREAFIGCTSLEEIVLLHSGLVYFSEDGMTPSNNEKSQKTFWNCNNIRDIYIHADGQFKMGINSNTFTSEVYKNATLHVREGKGLVNYFRKLNGWKNFNNIEEMEPIELVVEPYGGEVRKGQKVYMTTPNITDNNSTTISYCIDHGDWLDYSITGITINQSCTLSVQACNNHYSQTTLTNIKYTINNSAKSKLLLSASPSGGQVSAGATVTLTAKADGSTVSGCDIYFTTDGTTPSRNNGTKYNSGITINNACTLKAIAYKSGYEDSEVLTATYTIKEDTKPKLVLSASPSGGQVSAGTIVTLTAKANGSTVSGCDIYYTTNGTTPSKSNGTKYSSGITINSACTLKAIAYKSGYEDSDVLSATYTIKENPKPKLVLSASPSGGQVSAGATVTLTAKANGSTVYGCDIYYTTDGTKPSRSNGTKYSSGITINSACTLKAIAYKSGYEDSDVLTAYYTLELNNGDLFTANTIEGVTMCFKVLDLTKKTCEVSQQKDHPAVNEYTSGTITIPSEAQGFKVVAIGKEAFRNPPSSIFGRYGCSSLSAINIPNTVEAIGDEAFSNCESLTSIQIPNSVTSIGVSAFYRCKSISSITIPASVKSIGVPSSFGDYGLFYGCDNLNTVKVASGNNIYDSRNNCNGIIKTSTNQFFAGCANSVIPSGVKSIGVRAFHGCKNLLNITIPTGVTEIGQSAFEDCSNLKSVSLPSTITRIGNYAFSKCDELNVLSLPNNLDYIGHSAFSYCKKLESLVIPKSVTIIQDNPVISCSNLVSLSVEEGNINYDSRNDCNAIIKTSDNKLIAACNNTIIPSNVTSIGSYAFGGCNKITDVVIPEGVQSLERYAFSSSAIRSITLPNSLTKIGEKDSKGNIIWAFDFSLSSSLEEVRTASVTPIEISDREFCYYQNGGYVNNALLIVPIGTKEKYRLAKGWKNFKTICEIGEVAMVVVAPTDSIIKVGETLTCTYTLIPSDANSSVEWSSDDSSIASVDAYGLVTGIRAGTTYINVTTANGKTDRCKVTVEPIDPTGIEVSPLFKTIKVGETFSCLYSFTPSNATSTVTWNSDDSSIASVNSSGVVTGKKGGTTNINAITANGISGRCEVTVVNLDMTVSAPSSGFSTFFNSESAYVLPNGLSAQVVTGVSNGKLTYKTIADGSVSGVVPKGVPVMLVSDTKQAGTFTLTSSESTATYTGENLLYGSDEATTTTGDGLHYKLSYGPSGTGWSDVFGWYWGAQNGAPFQIEGHKAWLVVPRGNGTRAAGFSVDGEALGIEDNNNESITNNLYYDLQGRRVSQPTNKGVYIRNGHKVVNR